MDKAAFLPFSIGSGLIAGFIARKMFAAAWGMIDEGDPPKPEHRDVRLGKLAAAVALEGLVFSLTRAMVDHGSRRAFERFTGSWPGEESPEKD
jgi:hypothetical protein